MLGVKPVRDEVEERRSQIRADVVKTSGDILEEGHCVGVLQGTVGVHT